MSRVDPCIPRGPRIEQQLQTVELAIGIELSFRPPLTDIASKRHSPSIWLSAGQNRHDLTEVALEAAAADCAASNLSAIERLADIRPWKIDVLANPDGATQHILTSWPPSASAARTYPRLRGGAC